MSLADFAPLPCFSGGPSVAVMEQGGRIVYGQKQDVAVTQNSNCLSGYPALERAQLMGLQHSLSREDVRTLFLQPVNEGQDGVRGLLSSLWQTWFRNGFPGLLRQVGDSSDGTMPWPFVSISRHLLKVECAVSSLFGHMFPSLVPTSAIDKVADGAKVLNWKSNWIRAIAFHPTDGRLAICQRNDYIRCYQLADNSADDGQQKAPITLRHGRQKNVADMAWSYTGGGLRVLRSHLENRPQFAHQQVLWDNFGTALYTVAPVSKRILIWDVSTKSCQSISAWTGGSLRRIVPTKNFDRLLVQYSEANIIRVYDTSSWKEESWTNLPGRCRAAVWSPNGDQLLFVAEHSVQLFAVTFNPVMAGKAPVNTVLSPGQPARIGASKAVPVYDFGQVEQSSIDEAVVASSNPLDSGKMGGPVHDMVLSRDGCRLAVSFLEHPETVALFVVGWTPSVILTPCGFIRGVGCGYAELMAFDASFSGGSLLTVVWSNGRVQYIPLLYTDESSPTRRIAANLSRRIPSDYNEDFELFSQ